MVELIRINKFLAQCNVGSRREVEKYIEAGLVCVNGKIERSLSTKINPETDEVKYKDEKVSLKSEPIYLMLNKPKKYLVTKKDDFGRKTVYDLLPDFDTNLSYIGRLDYMTEGLLIMTNDGAFSEKVIHPRYKLQKIYKVTSKGMINEEQVDRLQTGVVIDGRKTSPAKVHIKKKGETKSVVRITIYEGRKRQVRRMFKTVGSEVLELKRLQIGTLHLGKLPLGMWRFLTKSEVRNLLNNRK